MKTKGNMVFVQKRKFMKWTMLISAVLLIILMIMSATFGAANISFFDALKVLVSKIPFVGKLANTDDINKTHMIIIMNLRLPRILLGAIVGAGLGVVGAALQGMFKNPMADPYVLGISSGASFGAAIAIALGIQYVFFGSGVITLFAFLGSIITILFVYNIAKTGGRIPSTTLLLSGIAINSMLMSLVSIIMIFNRNKVEDIVFWVMGSVASSDWKQVGFIFPIVVLGIIFIIAYSRDLNIMSTGEESARNLGVEVEKVKKLLILLCSLMVAACVSVSGVIGFVGLIIPHSIRLLAGADHRALLPFSAIGGAAFMVVCDTISRSIMPPMEIPVGAVTSIFGAPYFIYLLYKNKKKVFG